MELKDTIEKRTSVRKFTDYEVTDRELMELMEAARLAPSWANTQVCEYIIVRDKDLIEKLTDTYSETNPARKGSASCSAIIVACAKKDVSGCKNGEQRTVYNEWFMFDLGLAVQNISLRAHDLGLGTVIVGSMDHEAAAKLLNVPSDYALVAAIPVGKPLDPDKSGPNKKEIEKFVYKDSFGKIFN